MTINKQKCVSMCVVVWLNARIYISTYTHTHTHTHTSDQANHMFDVTQVGGDWLFGDGTE
jgi:hypothetical protein